MMSWCGENTSYGRVSHSGKGNTGTSEPASRKSSTASRRSTAWALEQITITGCAAAAAASAMASAGAVPYSWPQWTTPVAGRRAFSSLCFIGSFVLAARPRQVANAESRSWRPGAGKGTDYTCRPGLDEPCRFLHGEGFRLFFPPSPGGENMERTTWHGFLSSSHCWCSVSWWSMSRRRALPRRSRRGAIVIAGLVIWGVSAWRERIALGHLSAEDVELRVTTRDTGGRYAGRPVVNLQGRLYNRSERYRIRQFGVHMILEGCSPEAANETCGRGA